MGEGLTPRRTPSAFEGERPTLASAASARQLPAVVRPFRPPLPKRTFRAPMPHILVIEDDARLRGVLARVLRIGGYEVTEAADGPSGLAS